MMEKYKYRRCALSPHLCGAYGSTLIAATLFLCLCGAVYCDSITSPTTEKTEAPQPSIYTTFSTEQEALAFQKAEGTKRLVQKQDFAVTISNNWWKASQFLILQSHEQGTDHSSTVRSLVGDTISNCEELLRLLNKQHDDIDIMPPAFQWAQSSDQIFLNIKFGYRWSSPGALSIENEVIKPQAKSFYFSGVGTHSGLRKKYVLSLDLYDEIIPEHTEWNFASVGKVNVILKKANSYKWKRLTLGKQKIPNMLVWWDMQAKYSLSNYTKPAANNTDPPTGTVEEGEKDEEL